MAYERQYYTNGDVLDAGQMNHMETGIKENSDNIDKLSEDIATKASAIKEKASGEVIVVTGSAEAKPLGLAIDGKSEQNQYSGKNLLPNVGKTQTINGVTFTVNEDGSVTANGTATANTAFYIISKYAYGGMFLPVGSYVLSGCPSGGSDTTYRLQIYGLTESGGMAYDFGNGVSMEFANENADYNVVVFISSGYTANKLRFYPMISLDGGEYEPYCGGIPSPNPSYPQEIRNIGKYDEASGKYEVEVKCTGKNLAKFPNSEFYINGVTWKCENGAFTAVGTATGSNSPTSSAIYYLLPIGTKGSFLVSGAKGDIGVYVRITNSSGNKSWPNGIFVLDGTEKEVVVYCQVDTGKTVNGTVYPMLRYAEIADDTYEPYKETTATVLLDEPLRGIGEYTDEICNVDGVWGVKSIIGLVDNNLWAMVSIENGTEGHRFGAFLSEMLNEKNAPVLCSHYIHPNKPTYSNAGDYIATDEGDGKIRIRTLDKDFSTIEEFKAFMFENNVETQYIKAEPTFTPFEEQTVLDGLSMFYPTTVISNDCNANMEVTYIADTKAYIDKKFAELATAMV